MESSKKLEVSGRIFVLLCLFLVGLFGYFGFRMYEIWNTAHGGNFQQPININGDGKFTIVPNIGKIYWNLNESGETSEIATQKSKEKMAAVRAVLQEIGIKPADVGQGYVNTFENFESSPKQKAPEQHGFMTSADIIIVIVNSDASKIKLAFQKLKNLGIKNVDFSYAVSDEELAEKKQLGRRLALEDIMEKSRQISELTGLRFGRVVSYYDEYYPYGELNINAVGMGQCDGKGCSSFDFGQRQTISLENEPYIIPEPREQEVTIRLGLSFEVK
ncbi:SIMPL domain-containing protein [Candidatus Peregrinibacteria bacterium]|nr:SIMPL domain-containing protein [Candidatus Peregrinibacteria bacterium]